MAESVKVHGLKEVERRLQALPEKLRRRHVRQALEEGAEIIRAEAEANAPRRQPAPAYGWLAFVERPGEERLKENITKKISVTEKRAKATIGIDYKKVKHGHLVEFGTKTHKVGKITHPGGRKHPFMRPAFENKGDEALRRVTTRLARAVEKEA